MIKHRSKTYYPRLVAGISLVLIACLPGQTGCGNSAPRSQNYFALAQGNSWLYQGSGEGQKLSVEMKVVKPDPALNLSGGVMDVQVTGNLGNYKVSESGLFLEATPADAKLWGVSQTGAAPQFFDAPYIWLQKPLQVGSEYNTAIQGTPSPAKMVVTGRQTVSTPWGPREGFSLEENGGTGGSGARLVFVPYLGFNTIAVPDWPVLDLKDASLK